MFVILAVFIVLSSLATVLTKSIVRAATYLLFVLLGTAGLYFLMGYTFLGAVQVMVYAGGIIVLYVFSILLTSGRQEQLSRNTVGKVRYNLALTLSKSADKYLDYGDESTVNPNLQRVRHQFADAIRKLMQDIAYKLRIQMTACQHAEEMLRML